MEPNIIERGYEIILDAGARLPYVIIIESTSFERQSPLLNVLCQEIRDSLGNRVVAVKTCEISKVNWEAVATRILAGLKGNGVRHATIIGIGGAASIVQAIALNDPKFTRKVILVDGTTSPHPTFFSKLVDKIESALPLGLPLRASNRGFDSRSFLQRIRAPVLIVVTQTASSLAREQSREMVAKLPTAWLLEIESGSSMEKFLGAIGDFENVRAKCPMERRAR